MAKVKFDYDLIVIGSGPAGSVAAEMSARSGRKVAIIEQGILGGSAPSTGDIPLQAMLSAAHAFDAARRATNFGIRTSAIGYNYPSIRNWKELAIKRSGVGSTVDYFRSRGISVFKGRAHLLSPNEVSIARRHLSAEKILLATGAEPLIPKIPGLEKISYLTAATALDLIRPPKSLLIIGAGSTGVQFAELFAIFGTKVYLLDLKKRLLPRADDEVSEVITDTFRRLRGMEIITSASVKSVQNEASLVRVNYLSGAAEHSIKVERVMVAAGWSPNIDIGLENAGITHDKSGVKVDEKLMTSSRNIFAAGAVAGQSHSTQSALYDGKVAAENLWTRNPGARKRTSIPRVIWTTPEIAIVGSTEANLVREDVKFETLLAQNPAAMRANVANFGIGFTKILCDSKGLILGASVVAPHAAETIGQLTLAINCGLSVRDLADTLTPFGAWSELTRLAAAKSKH